MTKKLRRERADQLAAYMRAHSKNFHMAEVVLVDEEMSWAPAHNNVANVKQRIDENWCGTTCCIAGYAVCLFGEPADYVCTNKAAELLGLSGFPGYAGIAGMLFVPGFGVRVKDLDVNSFPAKHTLDNTDVEVAIEALYNAVRLQEELEEQALGE